MPDISLTDFVDFVTRTGNPRLTRVRQVRNRGQYHPAFDFWRGLRQAIVRFHKQGSKDLEILDRVARTQTDPRKRVLFAHVAQSHKQFVEKKRIHWFDPPKDAWQADGLVVRVNPELGLRFDGQSYVIKLHFREEELTKRKIEMILLLMEETLRAHCPNGERFAILDVRNGNFITAGDPDPRLVALLHSEAVAFMSLWESLDVSPELEEDVEFEELPVRRVVDEPEEVIVELPEVAAPRPLENWEDEPVTREERLEGVRARNRNERA
jgi:hypothetical protein